MQPTNGTQKTIWFCTVVLLVGGWILPTQAEVSDMGKPTFERPAKIAYSLDGPLGDRVEVNLENWLLTAPLSNPGMIEMFRIRDRKPVPSIVPWAGEFIGKYLISAIQAHRMVDDPRLEETIRQVLHEFIATQAEDGYLGPFRKEERLLAHWDLWGHYHALLALLMWHEETGEESPKEAAIRAADLICETYLDTDRRPLDAGSDEMNLSIIHAMGRLYRATGNERYLQMMRVVEKDWESAGDYFRQGLAGVDFYKLPRHRWESLHDLQGLVELYRITGNEDYKTAFVNLWRSIARFDRHNTGGFTTNEAAIGNPYTPGAIETCCTTAWSAMTMDMLYLTGESMAADELELSLWNSIIGSQHPSGRWWTYDTPMDGKRAASAHSIVFQARPGTPELNCCSVNAPRGLGMISEWGILVDSEGALIVNYYGLMDAVVSLANGKQIEVRQHTDYPVSGRVELEIVPSTADPLRVRFRIPGWSKETSVKLNGKPVRGVQPGTYLDLERIWKEGDRVELYFDTSIRTWVGDGAAADKVSLYRGPLLLAFDQHHNSYDCDEIPALDFNNLDYTQLSQGGDRFRPLFRLRFEGVDGRRIVLCDFATAGAYGTQYLSWLPVTNAPPPPFHLLAPEDHAKIPAGPHRFDWTGPRKRDDGGYAIAISEKPDMSDPILSEEGIERSEFILRKDLKPGRTYYWQVTSQNENGSCLNEAGPRSLVVDESLRNEFIDHPALLDFREDGLVAGSLLAGDGTPVYGYLAESVKVEPAEGRDGKENGAVRFSGEGMLRYGVPYFPATDYTFVAWICPEEGPADRLAQVFSAWAQGGDDPLRVVIDKGEVFARIEGNGNHSTPGVPVKFGEWVHVAAVKAGGKLTLFVNGKPAGSTGVPAELSNTFAKDFALGANPHHTGPEFYHGRIQEFAFYAKAFDETAVERIWKEGLDLSE